jgi:hypothetical protein
MFQDNISEDKSLCLIKAIFCLIILFYSAIHLNAKEQSCFYFLHNDQIQDLKYFEGRNIHTRLIPVEWSEQDDPNLVEHFKNLERKPKLIAHTIDDLGLTKQLNLKTVLYPSAGYDATTGFLVTSHVTTVVGIDNHPFMNTFAKSLTPEPFFSVNDKGQGWTVISEVDFKNFVGEIILARLKAAIPGFRLHKVLHVQDSTKDNLDSSFLSHGVIVFDTGEGTLIRRYIHLQSPVLNDYEMRPTSWWKDIVLQNNFQILIRKAAMSFYNYPIGLELIRHLKENQGLLIDGDNDVGSFPSYDLDQELAETSRLKLPISGFGYDSVTKIYFFLNENKNKNEIPIPQFVKH